MQLNCAYKNLMQRKLHKFEKGQCDRTGSMRITVAECMRAWVRVCVFVRVCVRLNVSLIDTYTYN